MIRAAALALGALVCVAGVSPVFGAGAIFPAPLHLTREIHDPVSGKTVVLNEYGYGNRLVSVRGDVTAIADYEKGELTEIDRGAGTYSVTRFETLAKLQRSAGVEGGGDETAPLAQKAQGELKAAGAKATRSGHTADFFRAESEAYNVEIAFDQSVRVSKEALEVLLGAAYPATRSSQHDLVINAARGGSGRRIASNSAPQAAEYALPLEQLFAVTVGDERVELRSSVLRVGNEPPPADAVAIPAGARLVLSRSASVLRELEALDAPPLRPPAKP